MRHAVPTALWALHCRASLANGGHPGQPGVGVSANLAPGTLLGFLGTIVGFLGTLLGFLGTIVGFLGTIVGFLGTMVGFLGTNS